MTTESTAPVVGALVKPQPAIRSELFVSRTRAAMLFLLPMIAALAVVAAMLIPTTPADDHEVAHHAHAELALVPGGTIVEDD